MSQALSPWHLVHQRALDQRPAVDLGGHDDLLVGRNFGKDVEWAPSTQCTAVMRRNAQGAYDPDAVQVQAVKDRSPSSTGT